VPEVEPNRQRRGTTRGLIGASPKLRRRGIGGVLFEHDFASRALQFGFERAMAQAIAHRQRFVEVWSRRGLDRQPRIPHP